MVISVMTYCQAFTQYLELVFTLEIIIWKTEPGSLHEIGRWNVMVTILNINFVKSKIYSNTLFSRRLRENQQLSPEMGH